MNNRRAIRRILAAWGSSERRLPLRHEVLKGKILASVESVPPEMSAAPRHLPWLSFALTGFAALVLLVSWSGVDRGRGEKNAPFTDIPLIGMPAAEPRGADALPEQSSLAPSRGKESAPDFMPRSWPEPNIPITDPREFLKTDYRALMRTRRVEELARRIETTARGFGGRMDSMTSSKKFGFVAFVVPANKFEAFRREFEGLVNPRFLTVEIRTENLLPQKQSLEERKKQAEQTLSEFRANRQSVVSDHNGIVSALQSQLAAIRDELALLRDEETDDPARKAEIASRIQELLRQENRFTLRLINENASYGEKINSLDQMIRNAEMNLQNINSQDQGILDTVATVRGTVSLNWISIGEVIELYVSFYWIAFLFSVAAVASYLWHRRRSRMALP